ncbi:MAG: amidohydrolase family protein, partial [Candidatus Spechtbacterales bacterium]
KGFLDAFKELYVLAKETGVNMEFSHLKVHGEPFWGDYEAALSLLSDEGVPNTNFDIYPYTTTSSVLYSFFPAWASEGGNAGLITTLQNRDAREKLIKELESSPHDFGSMVVSMGMLPASHIGASIADLAKKQGISVADMTLQLIEASHNQVIVLVKAMSEENTRRAMQHPRGFITTSAPGFSAMHHQGMPHPRSFGSFPRFLRMVREEALLPWEEAVHKITLGPAAKIGLAQRGKIAEDWFADIAVWDPEAIMDTASFEDPYHYPRGVKYTIVNGEVASAPEQEIIICAGKPIKKKQ